VTRAVRWTLYGLAGYGLGSLVGAGAFLYEHAKWTLRGLDLSEPFDVWEDE
jgi:hypothetical protein